eukprot:4694660-Pyramimonas_sp.AAC.1
MPLQSPSPDQQMHREMDRMDPHCCCNPFPGASRALEWGTSGVGSADLLTNALQGAVDAAAARSVATSEAA